MAFWDILQFRVDDAPVSQGNGFASQHMTLATNPRWWWTGFASHHMTLATNPRCRWTGFSGNRRIRGVEKKNFASFNASCYGMNLRFQQFEFQLLSNRMQWKSCFSFSFTFSFARNISSFFYWFSSLHFFFVAAVATERKAAGIFCGNFLRRVFARFCESFCWV